MFDKLGAWAFGRLGTLVALLDWAILSAGSKLGNWLIGISNNLLGTSPKDFNGGAGWNVIAGNSAINKSFVAIAGTLVVIFWGIKLCADNCDIRQKITHDTMIKELTILIVTEWLVTNSLTIVNAFFELASKLLSSIGNSTMNIKIPNEVKNRLTDGIWNEHETTADAIKALVDYGVSAIPSVLFFFVAIGCGTLLIYYAFVRFVKVLLIIPYASLASSTVAGPHSISHTATGYWKYALACILEVVTMKLAIVTVAALSEGNGLHSYFTGVDQDTCMLVICAWTIKTTIMLLALVGAIKESEIITQKVIGA